VHVTFRVSDARHSLPMHGVFVLGVKEGNGGCSVHEAGHSSPTRASQGPYGVWPAGA